jgi:hypothetical protein
MENLESVKSAKFEKFEKFAIENLKAVTGGDRSTGGTCTPGGYRAEVGVDYVSDCGWDNNEDGSSDIDFYYLSDGC